MVKVEREPQMTNQFYSSDSRLENNREFPERYIVKCLCVFNNRKTTNVHRNNNLLMNVFYIADKWEICRDKEIIVNNSVDIP